MARSSDPKKVALWQRRFRRFLDSGVSVARFCAAEQVSESLFYYWRKKLGPLRRGGAGGGEDFAAGCGHRSTRTGARPTRTGARPTRTDAPPTHTGERSGAAGTPPTRTSERPTHTGERPGAAGAPPVFRPVTVVPASASCGVVVRLPDGVRIEVDAAHLDALRAVVAETVRGAQSRATESGASRGLGHAHSHGGSL